jgi:hypothetical protein
VCTRIVNCVSIEFEECIDFEELKMNRGPQRILLNVPFDLEFDFYTHGLHDFGRAVY